MDDVKKAKSAIQVDRVAIGKSEAEKIEAWILQLKNMSKGFLKLTKSDIVNFLIRDHKTDLSSKEIAQIRSDNYNPVRHMNWIAQELKTALSKNDFISVAILQGEIKGVELSATSEGNDIINKNKIDNTSPSNQRYKKSKKIRHDDVVESLSIEELQKNLIDA